VSLFAFSAKHIFTTIYLNDKRIYTKQSLHSKTLQTDEKEPPDDMSTKKSVFIFIFFFTSPDPDPVETIVVDMSVTVVNVT
jgi:hypothetical protein